MSLPSETPCFLGVFVESPQASQAECRGFESRLPLWLPCIDRRRVQRAARGATGDDQRVYSLSVEPIHQFRAEPIRCTPLVDDDLVGEVSNTVGIGRWKSLVRAPRGLFLFRGISFLLPRRNLQLCSMIAADRRVPTVAVLDCIQRAGHSRNMLEPNPRRTDAATPNRKF